MPQYLVKVNDFTPDRKPIKRLFLVEANSQKAAMLEANRSCHFNVNAKEAIEIETGNTAFQTDQVSELPLDLLMEDAGHWTPTE